MRTAALLTCHNRKEKTRKCLSSLLSVGADFDVYVVDDGSTDGTYEMIRHCFPKVNIIRGNGDLYWSRGMHAAMKEAVKKDYDFYIWLNDDVELMHFFWDELKMCSESYSGKSIVSGLVGCSGRDGVLYGGYDDANHLLQETGETQNIKYMNGNVVLIPRTAVRKIGIIDPVYHHDLGDVDYGLTAQEHGIKVITTKRIIAFGHPNHYCRVRKWGVSLIERFAHLNHPLGSPILTNFYFRKKHFGLLHAFAFCSFLIVLNILPDFAVARIWGDYYKDK